LYYSVEIDGMSALDVALLLDSQLLASFLIKQGTQTMLLGM